MFWAYLAGMSLFLLATAEIESTQPVGDVNSTTPGYTTPGYTTPDYTTPGYTTLDSRSIETTTELNTNRSIKIKNQSKYPYVVSIGSNAKGYYKHLCVGVIIAKEFVLTAAHCFKRPPGRRNRKLFVAGGADRLNSLSQTRFFVVSALAHPQFRILGGHDIGLVRVFPHFTLDNVRFRAITFQNKERQDGGHKATLLGWGRVKIKMVKSLQKLYYKTIDNDVCLRKHRFHFITSSEICATHYNGPIGACDGDSGGPLLDLKTELIYGLLSYTRRACVPRKAYAFTRISTHSSWIVESMPKMLKININPGNYTIWKDRQ